MRTKIFISLIVVSIFLISFVSAEENDTNNTQANCYDTDGGRNYFIKGSVSGIIDPSLHREGVSDEANNIEDVCTFSGGLIGSCTASDECKLAEYYCDNNFVNLETKTCENGCSGGVCLQGTTTTNVCAQQGTACCKNGACNSALITCQENSVSIFQGCDENCNARWTCNENSDISKEQIKCIFLNSKVLTEPHTATENCYAHTSDGKFGCKWDGNVEVRENGERLAYCIAEISGKKSETVKWKSSCGGYATTILDGENEFAKFDCLNTQPPSYETWFRNAYWVCYDGTKAEEGSQSSCKSSITWKKYAHEFCQEKCSSQPIEKCGVSSFGVYNECKGESIIEKSVCGNNICESGEGQICIVSATASCETGKECELPKAKCNYVCPQDCKQVENIYIKFNEKFKLQVSQYAKLDKGNEATLSIKLNDLFTSKCATNDVSSPRPPSEAPIADSTGTAETAEQTVVAATIERYDSITGSVISTENTETSTNIIASSDTTTVPVSRPECEKEPYAVLQLKNYEQGHEQQTEVFKLSIGEKRKTYGVTLSFLDYDRESKTGVFLVLNDAGTFECPENCKCDINGNKIKCKKIEKCPDKTILCPDGTCQEKCEILPENIECNFGCIYNNKCLPVSVRAEKLFCSIDGKMESQYSADKKCDNNFECDSNVCIDSKCISSSFIEKFFNWLRKLFGSE